MNIKRSIIVMATALAVAGSTMTLTANAVPPHRPVAHCPAAKGLLPLKADSVQRAADAAQAEAARLYRGLDTRGAQVMSSARAGFAGDRGGQVSSECGGAVANRTIVVQMLFPRELPSASLSEAVVWAGRFGNGYRVWFQAH